MAVTDHVARAGLLRRTGALALDYVLVTVVLQMISAVAFPLSAGLVQTSNGITLSFCRTLQTIPAGLPVPKDFRPTAAKRCTDRFLIFQTGETVILSQSDVRDGFTQTQNLTWHVAANGEIITPIDLGGLGISLLLLLRWLFDCGTGTPGRRLCRNWLVPADDIANAHGRTAQRRFGLRYLVVFLSILPAPVAAAYTTFPWNLGSGASMIAWLGSVAGSLIVFGPAVLAIGAILLRRDAFYDRAAGTHVVRG